MVYIRVLPSLPASLAPANQPEKWEESAPTIRLPRLSAVAFCTLSAARRSFVVAALAQVAEDTHLGDLEPRINGVIRNSNGFLVLAQGKAGSACSWGLPHRSPF